MEKQTLNQKEAAARVGVCPGTLRLWRKAGTGPKYIVTPSGRVRFPVAELNRYLQAA